MYQHRINTIEKVEWGKIIIDCILFLILPPIIGLPYIIFKTLSLKNKAQKTDYISFMVCIAVYFAAINATKMPESDQLQYWAAYMNVPKIGFIKSLMYIYGFDLGKEVNSISGEFMNGVYNYFGYYFTFGYYPLYAALLTFANYIFNFLGIYKFANTLKSPHIPIVCGILILSFFYLYFQYLLQIQKQFLAQSIMMYVLASYAVSGKLKKKEYFLMLCAVFTHAATLLFIPLILYKPLRASLTKEGLIFLGIVFSTLIIMGPRLAGNIIFSDNKLALTYGLNRIAESEIKNDGLGLVFSQVVVIAIPIAIIVLKKLWTDRKKLNNEQAFILNIILLLLLTVVAMFKQPLAQYRYFMMIIAFMPYAYFFVSKNIQARDNILKLISLIMIVWFYYQFEKIVWDYAPEMDIIIKSPILLIFGNYYQI